MIAAKLGTPLMPWQRYVVDVALEYDPETGRLWYREVDLTVPRQSGKTSLILGVAVDRALNFGGRQNIVYTAQTRNDARKKWEEEHVETLRASIFKSLFSVRLGNGQEAIRWKNGSRHGITANTEKSGHGATLDQGFIDEAFAQIDSRHEQAMRPAMITRPEPQLWVVSTAGTEESSYLWGKVEDGRARVEAGLESRIAYFEWSAHDDADMADPATWHGCMPALCPTPVRGECRCSPDWRHTVTEDTIRTEYESMKSKHYLDFCRAYGNQWVNRSAGEWVIPKAFWRACADPGSQIAGPIALCFDVAPESSSAAIGVAGDRADGLPHLEVIEHHHGTDWVVPRLVELRGRHDLVCDVVLDPAGPAGSLLPDLRNAGFDPVLMSARDQVQACGALYGKAKANQGATPPGGFRHIDQKALNDALAGAAKRDLGDAWAYRRKNSTVDIAPLVAVTGALWGLETFRIDNGPPNIW